jgi:hypothetical protein
MQSPNASEAAALLQNVSEEHTAFWFNHGVIAKSLNELSAALEDMNEPEFAYHVRPSGNDIAAWVESVIGDRVLASKLHLLSTLDATRRMVGRRVEELTAALPVVKSVEDIAAEHDLALVKAVVAAPAPEMAMVEAASAPTLEAVGAKKTAAKKAAVRKPVAKAVAKKSSSPAPAKKSSLFGRLLKR